MHFWFLPDTNELKLKYLDFTGKSLMHQKNIDFTDKNLK